VLQVRIEHGATWNLIYLSVHPDKNGFVLQDFTQAGAGAIDFQVVDIPPGLTAHHLHFDVAVGGRTHFAIDGVQLQDYVTDGFMQAGTPSIYAGVSLSTIPATPIAVGFANLVFTGE